MVGCGLDTYIQSQGPHQSHTPHRVRDQQTSRSEAQSADYAEALIRALTCRTSQQNPGDVLIRLNQIMRGWANYFKHAVCKHTLHALAHFVWWRVVRWLRALHRWKWKDVRRRFTTPDGRWKPITADGIELFNLESVPVTRYRWRGNTIPNPWSLSNHA